MDNASKAIEELQLRRMARTSIYEYIRYMSRTGLLDFKYSPEKHHKLIIDDLHAMIDGDHDKEAFSLPPGSAKALALNTPIPTPEGWKMMGDLKEGDQVFDENGLPCNVTWVSPVWKNRPVYKVTTDCGDEIIADSEHEWLVRLCGKHPVFKIKETHELCKKRNKRPMIKRAAKLELPEQDLLIHPYLLGFWLGDGHSNGMRITKSEDDQKFLRPYLHELGYETSDQKAELQFGILGIREKFVEYGLINDPEHKTYGRKHIPYVYLRGSYEQRLALLQGLIDSDGTVCKMRGNTTFCNTNKELALQFRELVRSLGVKAGWSESKAMLYDKHCGTSYRISFYMEGSALLPRKRELTRDQYRTPNTYIDVEEHGIADTVCIEVDSPSHLFLCGKSMTPTHNSTYISVILPTFLMAQEPTIKILCVSNSEFLSDDFARKRRAIMRSQEWKAISRTELAPDAQSLGAMGTVDGGSIYGAGAGSTITGLRADWIIMDDLVRGFEQANSMTQLDKIWSWLISEARSRGRPNCREVLVATRWSALDPIGRVLELTNEGHENWKYIRIPMECDSLEDPLNRKMGEQLWPEWFTAKMVSDAKRDPAIWMCLYQQMPLVSTGEWCPSQHIHIVPQPPQIMKYYIGIDIALSISNKSDFTVFAIFALGVDKALTLVEIYRNQRSVDHTAKDFIKICQKYEPAGVYIDDDNASKVWAKLVFEVSKQECVAVPMQILPIGRRDKETRAAPLRSYFLQDRISILQAPWNTDLLFEISKFPVGCRHDDQIDAMALVAAQLMKLAPPKLPEKTQIQRETIIGLVGGKMVLNESLDELFNNREDGKSRFSSRRI